MKIAMQAHEAFTPSLRHSLTATCLLIATALMAGCRQEMAVQPNYHRPLEPSTFFPDGRSSRLPPEGTIARGKMPDDPHLHLGRVGGEYVTTFPIEVTAEVLERGRQRYGIYCAVCHDQVGTGRGIIVQRGFSKPPNFHTDLSVGYRIRGQEMPLRDAPVGYLFEVITNGLGSMASYAAEVPVLDRWAIVAHIRVLQLSQHMKRDTLTAEERQRYFPEGGQP